MNTPVILCLYFSKSEIKSAFIFNRKHCSLRLHEDDCEALVDGHLAEENWLFGEKLVTVPLQVPKISLWLRTKSGLSDERPAKNSLIHGNAFKGNDYYEMC
jgi:hypothetical protein